MGIFKSRSNERRERQHQHQQRTRSGTVAFNLKEDQIDDIHRDGSETRHASNTSPRKRASNDSSETEPTATDSSDTSNDHRRRDSSRRSHRRSSMADNLECSSSEPEPILKTQMSTSNRSGSRSRRSKRRSKRSSNSFSMSKADGPDHLPYPPQEHESMTMSGGAFPFSKPVVNPFANKGEVYLCHDMATVADAMKLDLNTQVMLAYYDARSLEDFCLMAEADLKDMIAKASAMRRAIPPLQVRKIEVLREWVQEISKPKDESRLPAWLKMSQSKKSKRRSSKKIIPDSWKSQFSRDLPRLKHNLRKKGANLSAFALGNFFPNFQSISMCGFVE